MAQCAPQGTAPTKAAEAAETEKRPDDSQRPEAGESTLVLTPAESAEGMSSTLIMRLVAEAEPEAAGQAQLVSKLKSEAVQQALRLRGSRYRYGGTSRGGFDCSGFTQYVYGRLGVSLPHSSAAQFKCGKSVSRGDLKPGDLVFFGRGGRYVGHVGIFIGENKFVHASNPSRGVTVDSLDSAYYKKTYRGARRVR